MCLTQRAEPDIFKGVEGLEQSRGEECKAAVSFRPADNNPLSRLASANGVRGPQGSTNTNHFSDSLHWAKQKLLNWHSLIHFLADQASCGSMFSAGKNFNVPECIKTNMHPYKGAYDSTVNKQKTL